MFAQPGNQCLAVAVSKQAIQNRRRLARREAYQQAIPLTAAFVLVVVGAEADDRRTPHFRLFAGSIPHQLDESFAVCALPFREGIDKGRHACGGGPGFVLGHITSLSSTVLCRRPRAESAGELTQRNPKMLNWCRDPSDPCNQCHRHPCKPDRRVDAPFRCRQIRIDRTDT